MVLVELLAGFITSVISQIGYAGVFFLMVLESALIPVPSEVIMPFSGFLVATGQFNIFYILVAGTLGNLVGSIIAYYIGSYIGRNLVLRYGKYVFIDESHLNLADRWFQRFGDKIIFLSRNLPVVRTYISLPAGITKMNVVKFSIYTFLGSLIWCTILTYIGVYFGENWQDLEPLYRKFEYLIAAAAIIFVLWYINHKLKVIKLPKLGR